MKNSSAVVKENAKKKIALSFLSSQKKRFSLFWILWQEVLITMFLKTSQFKIFTKAWSKNLQGGEASSKRLKPTHRQFFLHFWKFQFCWQLKFKSRRRVEMEAALSSSFVVSGDYVRGFCWWSLGLEMKKIGL